MVDLLIFTCVDRRTVSLTPVGDIDLCSAPRLNRSIDAAIHRTGIREILIDLHRVELIDSTGLAALLTQYRQASCAGIRLHVSNAHGLVARALDLTGLTPILSAGPEA